MILEHGWRNFYVTRQVFLFYGRQLAIHAYLNFSSNMVAIYIYIYIYTSCFDLKKLSVVCVLCNYQFKKLFP